MKVKEFKINVVFGDTVEIDIEDFLHYTFDYKFNGGGKQHNLTQEDYDLIDNNLRAISDNVIDIVNKLKDKEELKPDKRYVHVPHGKVCLNPIKVDCSGLTVLGGAEFAEELFEDYVEPNLMFGKNVYNDIHFDDNVKTVNSHFAAKFAELIDRYNCDQNKYGHIEVYGSNRLVESIESMMKYKECIFKIV